MKINVKDFQVPEGEKVKLDKWPTLVEPVYESKKKYHKLLKEQVEELSALQRLHYASDRYALLLIFQAMDAAGKDGAIRHVMSGVNPQGCQVFSFKHPNATELDHDFLWRTSQSLPERHFQSLLLRGSIDRSCTSRDIAQSKVAGRSARRKNHLGGALSVYCGPGKASLS